MDAVDLARRAERPLPSSIWLRGAALGLLALIVYIPAMRAGIVFDDWGYLFNSRFVRTTSGLYDYWFTTEPMAYFPITHTTWWLEWRLWGNDPTGYHVVNIVLHALGVVVIWRVLLRLSIPGAFVAAAVFAVHPVAVESVAWIAERKNVLSMLFFGLSLLMYLRFEDQRRRRWYGLALVMFLLALLSKTSVATMPLVLLILAWWRRGRISKVDILRTVPFFVLAALLALVTVYFEQHQVVGAQQVRPEGFWSRLAASGWCIWFYLYKDVLPVRLSIIYPRFAVDPSQALAWVPLLALLAVIAVAWRCRRSWGRHVLAALGYFVAMLIPALGLVDIHFFELSLVADHFQHLAMLAPIVLVIGSASSLAVGRRTAMGAALVLIAVLAVLTWRQASAYKDDHSIWTDTIQKYPQVWVAHKNLGAVLTEQGRYADAIASYRRAVRIEPDLDHLHQALAFALDMAGQVDEALEEYREALRLNHENAGVYASMGLLLERQGKPDDALEYYRQALSLDPQDVGTHTNLAGLLKALGRVPEAMEHYRAILNLRPNDALAHYHLGQALRMLRRFDEAIDHFREALVNDAELFEAHNDWGLTLGAQGNARAAAEQYLKALAIKPDYANAHVNLGYLMWAHGQPEVALQHFGKALDSQPQSPAALNGLARILTTKRRDAEQALEYALKATQLTQHQNPGYLDTLAAAYAAGGRYDEAITTANSAAKIADAAGLTKLAEQIRARLSVYQRGEPVRMRPER